MDANEQAEWVELMDEFRALGGIAENVRLGEGRLGRGLFPEDPARPVHIRAPESLLLPMDEVDFRNGRFAVAANSAMGGRERAWLEQYENAFSWGRGGAHEAETFLTGLYALPDQLKENLARFFGMGLWLGGPTDDSIQKRFLDSRTITCNGRVVVMPLIELVNHGVGSDYDFDHGIGVQGTFSDEVLVEYSDGDSLVYFQHWGFATARAMALSLPTTVPADFGQFRVRRALQEGDLFEIAGPHPTTIRMPTLTREDKSVTVSSLLLGFRGFPRIPRGAFHRIFREIGQPPRDDIFDQVLFINRTVFVDFLALLEELEGEMIRTLRAVCRMQLTSLCHSFGVRPF